MNPTKKSFVVYIAYLSGKTLIYLAQKTQINLLIAEKVITLAKYLDFKDVFSKNLATELSEHSNINEHLIILKPAKYSLYRLIYNLKLVELETLKAYIETNLANNFIRLFKSSTGASILFIKKLHSSLCFCVNYQGPNNLAIKNWYLLYLINKLFDMLDQA